MTDLIAKPIIKNQYWVITDGDKKVGNVVADQDGFGVKLNGNSSHFTSTDDIKKNTKITFESFTAKTKTNYPYPEYPVTGKIYNSVMDIKRRLHLFTKTLKSKCLYAAGWFVVEHMGEHQITLCPKYIFIMRYPYQGPFKTKDEAEAALNSSIK